MRVYTYHEVPGASPLVEDPILIKEGFNWPAALFTVVWAVWHGLWLVALIILAAGVALEAALYLLGADPITQMAASAGLAAIVGFGGNDWRRRALGKQGYRFEGLVAAESVESARRRWFDRYPPGQVLREPGPQAT